MSTTGRAQVAFVGVNERVSVPELVNCKVDVRVHDRIKREKCVAPLNVPANLFGAITRQIEPAEIEPVLLIESVITVNSEHRVVRIDVQIFFKIDIGANGDVPGDSLFAALRSLSCSVTVVLSACLLLFGQQAVGQDLEPRRWTVMPLGVNVVGAGH